MKTYNSAPYFDDFDQSKNFHQILFKPGYAVQARELTQLQTILRDQIAKFGNHIFRHGSVVIPGNAFADLSTPYIKIQPTFNSALVSATAFENEIIIGVTTGIKAIVKKAVAATETDPITFYLSYITGGGTGTSNTFLPGEELYVESNVSIRALVATTNHTGFGALAFINSGVFYIRAAFVYIGAQSVVLSKYASNPSCHVLLKITETLVDEIDDMTLLDPAQGSYNYAAPGADRYKIELEFVSLPLGSPIDDNYVEIMRYNNGALEEHSRYAKYSELEKSLARRTYDESGNYLVEGFTGILRDHLKTKYNDGVYLDGNRDKFVAQISSGKGYVEGLEIETLSDTYLALDKARTQSHIKDTLVTTKGQFGYHIYVTQLKGLPDFKERQIVDLYNDNDQFNSSATKIGTCRVVAVDYHVGDPSSQNAIYKLFVDEFNIFSGYVPEDVGGVRFGVSGAATVLVKLTVPNASFDFTAGETVRNNSNTRIATVNRYSRATGELYVFKHDHTKKIPLNGDFITGSSVNGPTGTVSAVEYFVINQFGKLPIFAIPVETIKSLRNSTSNLYDISYTVWKSFTVTLDGAGYQTYTVTDGTIVPVEVGNCVAVSPTRTIDVSNISVQNGNVLIINAGSSYAGQVINLLIQVNKTGIQPKTKTLTTVTLNNVVPSSVISLGKADIYRIVSVTSNGVDVSSSYRLDNGQTDYYYGLGKLIQVGSLPTSNLTIVFEHFVHSGTGDYFCIDSYQSLGDDYLTKTPNYTSRATGAQINLSRHIDFRPTVGSNGTFSGGGQSTIDTPVIDSFIYTFVQYYVPRIDVVYLNKDNKVSVANGVPDLNPKIPDIPQSSIEISKIIVPAYTNSVSDVVYIQSNNYRYTMNDIKKLESRVSNIEYYSTLNAIESNLLSYDVVDPITGLTRYKNGYLVDNFSNYNSACDYWDQSNRCSFYNAELSAAAEDHETIITMDSNSSNFKETNGQLTLPYEEVAFISQSYSTRVTNLNPFMVFSWQGHMTIEPSFDNWVETQDLPTIFKTEEKFVTVQEPSQPRQPRVADAQWSAPVTPAPAPAPPESTVSVSALARDLGLVDLSLEGTAAWNQTVTFSVPQSVAQQTIGTINSAALTDSLATSDWANTQAWTNAITQVNAAFQQSGSSLAASSKFSADQIINFWQSR